MGLTLIFLSFSTFGHVLFHHSSHSLFTSLHFIPRLLPSSPRLFPSLPHLVSSHRLLASPSSLLVSPPNLLSLFRIFVLSRFASSLPPLASGLNKDGAGEEEERAASSLEEVINVLSDEGSDWLLGFFSFLVDVATPPGGESLSGDGGRGRDQSERGGNSERTNGDTGGDGAN